MKKLGFGMMRLPLLNENDRGSIDYEKVNEMVDMFLSDGFTYFDTAIMYCAGNSETAIAKCLTSRHPRDSYYLVDKISVHALNSPEEQASKFEEQLEKCGVTYFDTYLVHNMSATNYPRAKAWKTFEYVQSLKEQGRVRYTGFSFHDSPELLEEILNDNPEVDYVQLQINYIDWDNAAIASRRCYEIAKKHGKKVIVMEPLKGGNLVNVPKSVSDLFNKHNSEMSIASWGIRFAASHDDVVMVLSGMSNLEQMRDNLSYMKDFKPFDKAEFDIVNQAIKLINDATAIQCTSCEYCMEKCPKNIAIPQYFSLYNGYMQSLGGQFTSHAVYYHNYIKIYGKASDCILCKKCEIICPQHLPIVKHLKEVAKVFEDKKPL